jgi:hypothetical protein
MALSGVLSSCDTIATNSSLARVAASTRERSSCDSSYSRALSMAAAARRATSVASSRSAAT